MQLSLQKGAVDHECEPACALHDLEAQGGGATGKLEWGPGWLARWLGPLLPHLRNKVGCTAFAPHASP